MCSKEEYVRSGVDYRDLRHKHGFLEVRVTSPEQCGRHCSLGSACDMFFLDFTCTDGAGDQCLTIQANFQSIHRFGSHDCAGNPCITCTYLPHSPLKTHNLMDVLLYTKDTTNFFMYVLQCQQGKQ